MGFDDGADLFDCWLELGPLRGPEAHLAGMGRHRIDTEIAQYDLRSLGAGSDRAITPVEKFAKRLRDL